MKVEQRPTETTFQINLSNLNTIISQMKESVLESKIKQGKALLKLNILVGILTSLLEQKFKTTQKCYNSLNDNKKLEYQNLYNEAKENINEVYEFIKENKKKIEENKKKSTWKTRNSQIISLIENNISTLKKGEYVSLYNFLQSNYLLKRLTEQEVILAYNNYGSNKIQIKYYPSPAKIGLISLDFSLAQQVDYYFSSKNLLNDTFLKDQLKKNNGLIHISILFSFKKIKNLLQNYLKKEGEELFKKSIKKYSKNVILEKEEFIRILKKEEKFISQLNYYFSNENWIKDSFLRELSNQNDEQMIDLNIIFNFKKLNKIMNEFKNEDEINSILKEMRNKRNLNFEISKDLKQIKKQNVEQKMMMNDEEIMMGNEQEMMMDNDIEHSSKELTSQHSNKERDEELTIQKKEYKSIPLRNFILSNEFVNSINFENILKKESFTIMQYNILADFLCNFEYTSKTSQNWKYRRNLILNEINFYSPDICCLQEVQSSSLSNKDNHYLWFKKEFKNYDSFYKRKTTNKIGNEIGNLILWKKEKFELISKYEIELQKELMNSLNDYSTKNLMKSYPQVGLIIHLRNLMTNNDLLICCCHISCDFNSPHIQICQVQICLNEIQKLKEKCKNPSILFCGDFNSTPDTNVYSLLSNGKLDKKEFMNIAISAFKKKFQIPMLFEHNLKLQSSYKNILKDEPITTNVTDSFTGCLDYIWFSKLKPIAILDIPKEKEMKKEIGLPNSEFPSDHLPLLTKFQFE
eukprot:gene1890-1031_t